jgi:hypothetical protein
MKMGVLPACFDYLRRLKKLICYSLFCLLKVSQSKELY